AGAGRRGRPPTRIGRRRRGCRRTPSSRSRSRRARTAPARPSWPGPSRRACPPWWSGSCRPGPRRASPLLPLEASLAPDVGQRDEEDADEDEHLDHPVPAELVEDDGPGVEEDRLDVEDDEEHRRQVEPHRHAPAGGGGGDDARLVGKELAPVGLAGPEDVGKAERRRYETDDDHRVDDEWSVVAEQSNSRFS